MRKNSLTKPLSFFFCLLPRAAFAQQQKKKEKEKEKEGEERNKKITEISFLLREMNY